MEDTLQSWAKRHPFLIQYAKYTLSGTAATIVNVLVFFFSAWLLFPALSSDDLMVRTFGLDVQNISNSIRATNSMISNVIAFFLCNAVAYILNRTWVFQPGRHHPLIETLLFYSISGAGLIAGTILMGSIIKFFGIATSAAYVLSFLISSLLNFVMRKFFIFNG